MLPNRCGHASWSLPETFPRSWTWTFHRFSGTITNYATVSEIVSLGQFEHIGHAMEQALWPCHGQEGASSWGGWITDPLLREGNLASIALCSTTVRELDVFFLLQLPSVGSISVLPVPPLGARVPDSRVLGGDPILRLPASVQTCAVVIRGNPLPG